MLALLGDVLGLYTILSGLAALGTRKLQFTRSGRALLGPAAQLCGLMLVAPLPLSAITQGEVAFSIGARVRPDPDLAEKKNEKG
jgi:hypothetical protein